MSGKTQFSLAAWIEEDIASKSQYTEAQFGIQFLIVERASITFLYWQYC